MTFSTETLNGFWNDNWTASQQYAQLALEGAGQIFRTQTRYLADICQLNRDKHQHLWSDHPSKLLEHWLQFVESHLDFTAEMTHSHLDTTAQLQDAVSRIVKEQITDRR